MVYVLVCCTGDGTLLVPEVGNGYHTADPCQQTACREQVEHPPPEPSIMPIHPVFLCVHLSQYQPQGADDGDTEHDGAEQGDADEHRSPPT